MSEATLKAAMEAIRELTDCPVRVTLEADGRWEVEAFTREEARDGDPSRHTGVDMDGDSLVEMVLSVGASAHAEQMYERRGDGEPTARPHPEPPPPPTDQDPHTGWPEAGRRPKEDEDA